MAEANRPSVAPVRLTRARAAVLEVFLNGPQAEHYGRELTEQTGVGSGTLYPMLNGWADAGWLQARTEEDAHPGRPARRYYSMTEDGEQKAQALLSARQPGRRHDGRVLTGDDLMRTVEGALQKALQHSGVTVQVTRQTRGPGSESATPGTHRFLVTTTIE